MPRSCWAEGVWRSTRSQMGRTSFSSSNVVSAFTGHICWIRSELSWLLRNYDLMGLQVWILTKVCKFSLFHLCSFFSCDFPSFSPLPTCCPAFDTELTLFCSPSTSLSLSSWKKLGTSTWLVSWGAGRPWVRVFYLDVHGAPSVRVPMRGVSPSKHIVWVTRTRCSNTRITRQIPFWKWNIFV